jgi:hypothetical protein
LAELTWATGRLAGSRERAERQENDVTYS